MGSSSPGDTPIRILILDDELEGLRFLSDYLRQEGYDVETASRGSRALALIDQSRFDLLLLDLKMPEMDGLEVLQRARGVDPDLSVILMTGYATVETAVAAIKLGAEDVLMKPLELAVVGLAVHKALRHRRLRQENALLHERVASLGESSGVVFRSKAMADILGLAAKVAALPSTVLVHGESGTGKELISRAIHAGSPRADRPFVAVNCGVIPVALLESELFGHERGSFTGADSRRIGYFEAANGGTILLDEISETSLDLQVKLLRVLQERTFRRVGGTQEITTDARVIVSTNRNLADEVSAGRFRKDLYYRLNVIPIRVPALRERPEDIPVLACHFLEKYAKAFGREVAAIAPPAMDQLLRHSWPGNVRELENTIERAVALCETLRVDAVHMEDVPEVAAAVPPGRGARADLADASLRTYSEAREAFERYYFKGVLEAADGNVTEAARLAGLARQYLHAKLRKLGITGRRPPRDAD